MVMQNCLINGIATNYVSVQERGLQYGDGLFETIACVDNGLEFWQAHFNRLQQGAQRLQIPCPEEKLWLQDIALLCKNLSGNGVIKLILTRGCSERGYRQLDTLSSTRMVSLTKGLAPRYFDSTASQNGENKAADLCVCRQTISINPALAGIKHLNRLENVLARNEWKDTYSEGLMLDSDGRVIEGTMSNLFAVKQMQLLTPALTMSGVTGIIREKIIELADKNLMPVSITELSMQALFTMDALFICNSLLEILPVKTLLFQPSEFQTSPRQTTTWQTGTFLQARKLNQLLQEIKGDHVKRI